MQNQHVLKTLLAMVMLGGMNLVLGEDRYVLVPVAQLEFTDANPAMESGAQPNWRLLQEVRGYVTIDGGGEAYVQGQERWNPSDVSTGNFAAKVSQAGPLTGTLFLRDTNSNSASRPPNWPGNWAPCSSRAWRSPAATPT